MQATVSHSFKISNNYFTTKLPKMCKHVSGLSETGVISDVANYYKSKQK